MKIYFHSLKKIEYDFLLFFSKELVLIPYIVPEDASLTLKVVNW